MGSSSARTLSATVTGAPCAPSAPCCGDHRVGTACRGCRGAFRSPPVQVQPPPPRASSGAGSPPAAGTCSGSSGGDAPRYTTRLEHMDMVTLHPFHDLDLAESELSNYCSTLAPDAETEKCWQARQGQRAAQGPAAPSYCRRQRLAGPLGRSATTETSWCSCFLPRPQPAPPCLRLDPPTPRRHTRSLSRSGSRPRRGATWRTQRLVPHLTPAHRRLTNIPRQPAGAPSQGSAHNPARETDLAARRLAPSPCVGCTRRPEPGAPPAGRTFLQDCEELERLNDMTHQLLATGSVSGQAPRAAALRVPPTGV